MSRHVVIGLIMILLFSCVREDFEKKYNNSDPVPKSSPELTMACAEIYEQCQLYVQRHLKQNVWNECVLAKSRGKALAEIKVSQQQAAICWDAFRALRGNRYWFNGINF